MIRHFLALAALAALSACSLAPPALPGGSAPPIVAPQIVERADAAVTKAGAAFVKIQPLIDLLVAVLPARHAQRVLELRDVCEGALRAARTAVDLGGRARALSTLAEAMREIAAMRPGGVKRVT